MHGSRMFFEQDVIFSFGRHFPIARHFVHANGKRAVLYTTRCWRGVATNTHKRIVAEAIRAADLVAIPVDDVLDHCPSNEYFHDLFMTQISYTVRKAKRARVNGSYLMNSVLPDQIKQANMVAEFLGMDGFTIPNEEELVAWMVARRLKDSVEKGTA